MIVGAKSDVWVASASNASSAAHWGHWNYCRRGIPSCWQAESFSAESDGETPPVVPRLTLDISPADGVRDSSSRTRVVLTFSLLFRCGNFNKRLVRSAKSDKRHLRQEGSTGAFEMRPKRAPEKPEHPGRNKDTWASQRLFPSAATALKLGWRILFLLCWHCEGFDHRLGSAKFRQCRR